jgi:PAS domain S-box-containing protein
MPEITDKLNIFLIPPILFLITGVSLGLFSLLKGKRQYENILFALICFWYSLLMPVFISHHFLKGNIPLIMKIERFIHFFYVFGPAILVLFVHTIVNKKNRFIEIGAFIIASIISLFVFTDYYFYGMWEYQWGYIAKGGVVLRLFGIFAMSSIVYALVLSIKKLKTGIDHHTSLKIKYIMFAILFIGILTIGNMPALNGIGIYPPGNFAFIPILFMAWGIYRHDAIRINLYTRRRIAGAAVKLFVTVALSAVIPVSFWAMGNYGLSDITEKIIPQGIPPFLSFFCCVFLSFLSLRMGENRPDSIIFSLLMLVYALLSIDIFLNCIVTVPETGLRVSRFSHIFVVFIPALAMNLTHIVTKRQSGRRLLYGNYLISIILLFFSQSSYYLKGMHTYSWGMFAEKGIMFNIMSIVSALTLTYCIIVLFDVYRKNDNPYYKSRFLFLLIGFASIALLSLGNIPAMGGYDLYPPGNFIFIPAILFAIALFRNNISEMRRFSGKFFYYTIMTAAVFAAVYILPEKHSDSYLKVYTFSSIFVILIFNYLLTRLRDAITGSEFKRLKIAFENLSSTLSKVQSIEEIAGSISHSFFNNLSCGECVILIHERNTNQYCGSYIINSRHDITRRTFTCEDSTSINVSSDNPLLGYVRTTHSPVKQEEIEYWILNNEVNIDLADPLRHAMAIVPVFFESHMTALLLLGMKTDGTLYTAGETEFLYQLGINLGPHIENAFILQSLEETLEERTRNLRESEGKYRHFVENANEIIYKADLRGNFIYSNPAFQKKFEYTDEEIRTLNYLDLIPPDIRDSESEFYSGQLKNKTDNTSRELQVITKSGKTLWIEQTVKSIKDDSGNIIEFDSIVHDITERKAAEDALRKSEMHYQQLMENVSDAVFIIKLDGHFTYINPAVTRISGIAQNDLIGAHFLSIVHPEYREKLMEFYRKQLDEGIESTYTEYPILLKNYRILWVGQTIRMSRNSEGDIEFFGIARDITSIKNAEDARRDLEEAKSRFFSNISHEIRTPLTLMLGPIESVLQGDYGMEVDTQFFKNLHRNTTSLLRLVNNLLDFSKIEAGKMTLNVHEADIVSFARQYLKNIELAGKSKNIVLELTSSSDSIMLFFDPEKMDKVFMNLLSNSLKFTGTGGKISISLIENDGHCRITVSDTGEGIPGKSISNIFDRFSQADATSTRKYEGTGIGLALVKELVELHNGFITVESRYNEQHPDDHGTIFTINMPKGLEHFKNRANVKFNEKSSLEDYIRDYRMIGIREIEALKISGYAADHIDGEIETRPDGDKKTILIVDDNEDMRNFIKTLLQKHYNVILSENGEDGITSARNHSPDLIVTDVMMPVMNGFDMTSIIKNDEKLKTTPVIMLTADTDLMNKVAGLEYGADDYLHKPFNTIELLTRISSLLKNYEYQQIISRRNEEIENELEVARLLQERLLPASMPVISGYHEHAIYIPMDKIGGDFYDVENREGFLNIFIADVSGHGLPGAFLATITKIALENITVRASTNKVLYQLNNVILRHTVRSNFVTAFFSMIDIKTNTMRYASAGHSSPILYRKKNDEFIDLATKGTPLGWFNDIRIEEKTIQLESGDRIVFYTDGITECNNFSTGIYGEERFRKIIKEYSTAKSDIFSGELMDELEIYNGSKSFEDDITMVVLDVL